MFLHKLFTVLVLWISVSVGEVDTSRSFIVVNDSGVSIEMYWVEPETREAFLLSTPNVGLYNGAQMPFDSYVGHEFEIREMPAAESGECDNENNVCHSATFTVLEDGYECKLFVMTCVLVCVCGLCTCLCPNQIFATNLGI